MTTLIEKTSKKYKAQMLYGSLLILLGVVVAFFSLMYVSMGLILLGVAWLIVARILAWWNHD